MFGAIGEDLRWPAIVKDGQIFLLDWMWVVRQGGVKMTTNFKIWKVKSPSVLNWGTSTSVGLKGQRWCQSVS